MHGGRSTGPRTEAGLARLAAARTTHGYNTAEARALKRFRLTLLRRIRTRHTAFRYQDHLHPDVLARLRTYPPELALPPHPSGAGLTAAQDQMRRRAVAAALLPWKREIAAARQAHLAARAARLAAKAADPNARPPRPRRPRPASPHPSLEDLLALLSKPHAPEPTHPAHAPHVPKPHALIPDPTEPAAVPIAIQHRAHLTSQPATQAAHVAHASKPHALIPDPAEPTAPTVPPDLPNRAARRQWARQQRHLHRTQSAATCR